MLAAISAKQTTLSQFALSAVYTPFPLSLSQVTYYDILKETDWEAWEMQGNSTKPFLVTSQEIR